LTRHGLPCGGRCLECRPQRIVRSGLLRRSVDLLVAATDYVRERHVEAGVVPASAARTVPYGVEAGRRRRRALDASGTLRLGYLGTLGGHKGVDVLLAAFARAPAPWRLALAGTGPMAGDVAAAAARDPRITAVGHVTGEEKERFLDGLDVLVVPSVWDEPAGIVALEATMRGLPFVVTDRGGLRAMPGADVVAAGDPSALLQALRRLTEDGALAQRSASLLDDVPAPTLARSVEGHERALRDAMAWRQRRAAVSS